MLDDIVNNKKLRANGVCGIYKANAEGDDVVIEVEGEPLTLNFLRQQGKKASSSNNCLADFVAPKDSGKQDYMGLFSVTTGIGIEKCLEEFRADHDDYSEIMIKALADRLAEATAEFMHLKIRKEIWGYVQEETLDNVSLIKEKYQGIRPAPGYPACPRVKRFH